MKARFSRVILPKGEEKSSVNLHFHGYMGRGWDWATCWPILWLVTVLFPWMCGGAGRAIHKDGLRSPTRNTVKEHIIPWC